VRACFEFTNTGTLEIAGVRSTFQPRLDFRTAPREAADSVQPSQTAEMCYRLTAPEEINLTSQNRVEYAQ
jgi:hypothetical protein